MMGAGTDSSGTFGALVRQYRVAAGLSQEELEQLIANHPGHDFFGLTVDTAKWMAHPRGDQCCFWYEIQGQISQLSG